MSFSGMVKKELSGYTERARHCCLAELSALICACGSLEQDQNGDSELLIRTENEAILRKCFTLLKKTFNIKAVVLDERDIYTRRGKAYTGRIPGPEETIRVLEAVKVAYELPAGPVGFDGSSLITQRDCCRRAYIRGAFLASGSISDPEKGYHFEIVFPDEVRAQGVQAMIRSFGIDARIVLRKKTFVLYVKEGSQIVDLLGLMGADTALFDLENIRILKEMRNSVNRKVNCEAANINKTVSAAVKQIDDIRLIEKLKGLDSLSEGLTQVARLRLQYPDATLKELGCMLDPQVGKSGVNHRLRRLGELADELREKEEEQ